MPRPNLTDKVFALIVRQSDAEHDENLLHLAFLINLSKQIDAYNKNTNSNNNLSDLPIDLNTPKRGSFGYVNLLEYATRDGSAAFFKMLFNYLIECNLANEAKRFVNVTAWGGALAEAWHAKSGCENENFNTLLHGYHQHKEIFQKPRSLEEFNRGGGNYSIGENGKPKRLFWAEFDRPYDDLTLALLSLLKREIVPHKFHTLSFEYFKLLLIHGAEPDVIFFVHKKEYTLTQWIQEEKTITEQEKEIFLKSLECAQMINKAYQDFKMDHSQQEIQASIKLAYSLDKDYLNLYLENSSLLNRDTHFISLVKDVSNLQIPSTVSLLVRSQSGNLYASNKTAFMEDQAKPINNFKCK